MWQSFFDARKRTVSAPRQVKADTHLNKKNKKTWVKIGFFFKEKKNRWAVWQRAHFCCLWVLDSFINLLNHSFWRWRRGEEALLLLCSEEEEEEGCLSLYTTPNCTIFAHFRDVILIQPFLYDIYGYSGNRSPPPRIQAPSRPRHSMPMSRSTVAHYARVSPRYWYVYIKV